MDSFQSNVFLLPKDFTHACVAYLVKRYNEAGEKNLGRTILQKLCYFSKANGVPLPFRFEMHHYGTFCQEIFDVTDNLLVDDVIQDQAPGQGWSTYVPGPSCDVLLAMAEKELQKHRVRLDRVVQTFSLLDPPQMELVSTIHYVHSSYREWHGERPPKNEVVRAVLEIKQGKFPEDSVSRVYDILMAAGLLK
jgi:hypothetical protein